MTIIHVQPAVSSYPDLSQKQQQSSKIILGQKVSSLSICYVSYEVNTRSRNIFHFPKKKRSQVGPDIAYNS